MFYVPDYLKLLIVNHEKMQGNDYVPENAIITEKPS